MRFKHPDSFFCILFQAHMNKTQVTEFEKKLLGKRREITASKAAGANDAPADYGRDEGDRAQASQAQEMTWLRTSQQRGLLELVDAALQRIRDGSFGECQHCGGEVELKRLNAVPWTRHCLTCQELLEKYGR
jgi:DnaK suppressor protein